MTGPSVARTDGSPPIHVLTIPSSDRAFREHVLRVVHRHRPPDPSGLQDRLSRLFPRVVVRGREISGERPAWYVYRDGRWSPPDTEPWWAGSNVARLAVSSDGWIVDADPAARSLLGLGDLSTDPRHYSDLIVPGASEDAQLLFEVVAAGHTLDATVRLRPTMTGVIACDIHVDRVDDRLVAAIRLADDIPWEGIPSAPPLAVETLPASDAGFRDYVALLMSRMPEADPDGLSLRLHRLYPHARVDATDGHWTAYRDDPDAVELPDGWWLGDGLAVVRYDDEGLILEANPEAVALLGSELVGHHWQEFVTPGGAARVAEFLPIIRREGEVRSRFRMPGPGGALMEFDSYTAVEGETLLTVMRRLDA